MMKASSFSGSCLYSTLELEIQSFHILNDIEYLRMPFSYRLLYEKRPGETICTSVFKMKTDFYFEGGVVHEMQTLCTKSCQCV